MGGGAFAEWQPRYAEVGIATFPVNGKTPMVRGYLKVRSRSSARLVEKFPDARAFGLALKPSRITVLDVDTPDECVLADALAHHGDTPFIVRSGSGHFHAWYRRTHEGHHIRPDRAVPVDVLGHGYVVAPPSIGANGPYRIIEGSLADLDTLPQMRNPPAFAPADFRPGTGASGGLVSQGVRNKMLWRLCMVEAHDCDDFDALVDVARTANADCVPPLGGAELLKLARTAWDYTQRGDNLVGRQHLRIAYGVIDRLACNPDAYVLFSLLLRYHSDRRRFLVANAMAGSMPPAGWPLRRFRSARDRLLADGFIVRVRNASSIYGPAVYGWGPSRA